MASSNGLAEKRRRSSVVQEPIAPYFGESILMNVAAAADDIPAWGVSPQVRDRKLREFWPTESYLAGALFTTIARYVGFGWSLDGPPKVVGQVQRTLHESEHGKGWHALMTKVLTDLFSQDNGAFMEIIRLDDSPASPVIALNHLDAGRCIRTGKWEEPIMYFDILGKIHKLKWYHVVTLEEMPSPVETARNMQYCVVTRVLRLAQILRDISIYKREKISGRFARALHLVGGVQRRALDDALARANEDANNQGLLRYMQPVILATLDPTARVSHEVVDLASLPDGFDEEKTMRWYINGMALAFGADSQDYAPLPGGNLGSSQQSKILHLKSRGKGPAMFMAMVEQAFNFHGIMPRTVTFKFGEQDTGADIEKAQLFLSRARGLVLLVEKGIITDQVARQIMKDAGDLNEKYLALMGEQDVTPDIKVPSSVPLEALIADG